MATQILPHARPSTPAVLAYLAAGHSNAEAAQHFGIHERSVRRIKQRAIERDCATAQLPTERTAPAARHDAHVSAAGESPPVPVFPPTVDDIAHDGAMWLDPWTGELMPIVPGTHRKAWEAERKAAQARHEAAVMSRHEVRTADMTPADTRPDGTGQQPFSAAESEVSGLDSTSGEAVASGPVRTEPAGELLEERAGMNTTPVRVIVRVPQERQLGGLVGWLSTNPMLGPVPIWALLLLAFGALLVQLGVLG